MAKPRNRDSSHDKASFQRFYKVTTSVHGTANFDGRCVFSFKENIVDRVGICLQFAWKAQQDSERSRPASVRRVVEKGMQPITIINPHRTSFDAFGVMAVQHSDVRVIGIDAMAEQGLALNLVPNRRQHLCGCFDPAAQGRFCDVHALCVEVLRRRDLLSVR